MRPSEVNHSVPPSLRPRNHRHESATDPSFDVHTVDAGHLAINVAEGPRSGPPLLVLHGGSARWQSYRTLLEPLARQWHVYAPDLRGHGASSWTPRRYRLWDYAADIIWLLERVIGEPAAIVGHSLGAEVAVIVAAERPDLVMGVVAIDAPLSVDEARRTLVPDRGRLAWLRSLHDLTSAGVAAALRDAPARDRATGRVVRAEDLYGDDASLFADQAETLLQNDPTMLEAVVEFEGMHAGYDAAQLLPRIECPVLLLLADAQLGSAVSPEHADRTVRMLRRGQVVRVPGSTHGLVWEEPRAVLSAIEAFLERP
jgi:pimeloyl-ACP methyl ester carboxylesterase